MLWHAEHAACACCGAPLLTSRCHAARCRPLQAEYAFWMRTEGADAHAVTVDLPSGGTATLNRYVASVEAPRPEAYREDLRTAAAGATPDERRRIYSEIAAGTESGWDFSSRWMADRTSLASLHTSDLLPADLNAIMYKFEANLQQLSAMAGDKGAANIPAVIEFMDEYGLSREDVFESMTDFKFPGFPDPVAKIPSKTKAAFTRAYNKGTHKSQALAKTDAPVKAAKAAKPKGKGKAAAKKKK